MESQIAVNYLIAIEHTGLIPRPDAVDVHWCKLVHSKGVMVTFHKNSFCTENQVILKNRHDLVAKVKMAWLRSMGFHHVLLQFVDIVTVLEAGIHPADRIPYTVM